jgi:hypothetical protein
MDIMDHLNSPYPQIRSMWVPEAASCLLVTGNVQSAKANLISTLITDTVLLVIMLIGLLRLGFHERGTFGVGRLLWKQVGRIGTSILLWPSDTVIVYKGLIWLLITALVEVSMVVSPSPAKLMHTSLPLITTSRFRCSFV